MQNSIHYHYVGYDDHDSCVDLALALENDMERLGILVCEEYMRMVSGTETGHCDESRLDILDIVGWASYVEDLWLTWELLEDQQVPA